MSKCNLYQWYKWDIPSLIKNGPSVEVSCTCINAKSHLVQKAFLSGISERYFYAPSAAGNTEVVWRTQLLPCSLLSVSVIDTFQHKIAIVHFWHAHFNWGDAFRHGKNGCNTTHLSFCYLSIPQFSFLHWSPTLAPKNLVPPLLSETSMTDALPTESIAHLLRIPPGNYE